MIHMNLHYHYASFETRAPQAEAVNRKLGELREAYPGVPVFVSGDYNCNRESREFRIMCRELPLESGMLLTADNDGFSSGWHRLGETVPRDDDGAIDHIAVMRDNPEFVKLTQTVPVIIAHPFAPLEGELSVEIRRRIDLDRVHALCAKAAKMGVGFDINLCFYSVPEDGYRNDPMVAIMRAAREEGIRFTLGTDAHSLAALDGIRRAEPICEAIGITDSDWAELVRG